MLAFRNNFRTRISHGIETVPTDFNFRCHSPSGRHTNVIPSGRIVPLSEARIPRIRLDLGVEYGFEQVTRCVQKKNVVG